MDISLWGVSRIHREISTGDSRSITLYHAVETSGFQYIIRAEGGVGAAGNGFDALFSGDTGKTEGFVAGVEHETDTQHVGIMLPQRGLECPCGNRLREGRYLDPVTVVPGQAGKHGAGITCIIQE